MKLSKAQQKVIDDAKEKIDFAREHTIEEWFHERVNPWHEYEEESEKDKKYWTKRFNEEKAGITLAGCNSRTLWKLKEYGLIEIIEDSNGQSYGIDIIKVLNY